MFPNVIHSAERDEELLLLLLLLLQLLLLISDFYLDWDSCEFDDSSISSRYLFLLETKKRRPMFGAPVMVFREILGLSGVSTSLITFLLPSNECC